MFFYLMEDISMLYRDFGKTGEKVSVLGFGCMRLPIMEMIQPVLIKKMQ